MFVLGNFIAAAAKVLGMLLNGYMWVIVISALISWVNPDPYNPIVRFLRSVTEPVLRPIRRRLPMSLGIDISPIIVIAVIYFIQEFLIRSLIQFAYSIH